MKYIEIETKLSEQISISKELNKKIREVNSKISELSKLRSHKESELLIEFLGLNSTIEFNKYLGLSGVQTNIKKTPSIDGRTNLYQPYFRKGDIIKIIKLNKKSVVIECINKLISNRVDGKSIESHINPQSQFRIELESFKNGILSDSIYYNSFVTWIKRKESLEQLLES